MFQYFVTERTLSPHISTTNKLWENFTSLNILSFSLAIQIFYKNSYLLWREIVWCYIEKLFRCCLVLVICDGGLALVGAYPTPRLVVRSWPAVLAAGPCWLTPVQLSSSGPSSPGVSPSPASHPPLLLPAQHTQQFIQILKPCKLKNCEKFSSDISDRIVKSGDCLLDVIQWWCVKAGCEADVNWLDWRRRWCRAESGVSGELVTGRAGTLPAQLCNTIMF